MEISLIGERDEVFSNSSEEIRVYEPLLDDLKYNPNISIKKSKEILEAYLTPNSIKRIYTRAVDRTCTIFDLEGMSKKGKLFTESCASNIKIAQNYLAQLIIEFIYSNSEIFEYSGRFS
ncbi:hypothetical protein HN832_01425 [archaeon]|jgi:hypothetical protein|nr:hypothetical protein [archaeon]MBT4373956.1 hypothetical protein [archaeon]MBT4532349.1 hypothetical protein [archaeon]MBT7001935.1 hypothetical protein [archaeon]MBT7282052.1 hypothetical protein [archaeon]